MQARGARRPEDTCAPSHGPDFLCVGLQKGGTQWLYDQLQFHPDFWMPPTKELHFFDAPRFPTPMIAADIALFEKDRRALRARRRAGGWRKLDARDDAFYRIAASTIGATDRFAAYAALFSPKGALLSGDVTPGYSSLEPELIRQIGEAFPEARVVMALRDPVDRLWSRWREMANKHGWSEEQVQNPAALAAFLENPRNQTRSYPTRIASEWAAVFSGRFETFFLDDVASEPATTRARVIGFLGGDPAKPSGVAASHNRKAKAAPAPMRSAAITQLMEQRFAEERRACADMFGGPAVGWLDRPY